MFRFDNLMFPFERQIWTRIFRPKIWFEPLTVNQFFRLKHVFGETKDSGPGFQSSTILCEIFFSDDPENNSAKKRINI
jgi:hypothetical protein